MKMLFVFLLTIISCNQLYAVEVFEKCNSPKFMGSRVSAYHGKIAKKLRFDFYPAAKRHRTRLQTSLRKGVTFAGHYSSTTWGCGSNCIGFALIDVISGEVVFYSQSLSYHDLDNSEKRDGVPLGMLFTADSNLLLINPTCETDSYIIDKMKYLAFGDGRPRTYIWKSNHFVRQQF